MKKYWIIVMAVLGILCLLLVWNQFPAMESSSLTEAATKRYLEELEAENAAFRQENERLQRELAEARATISVEDDQESRAIKDYERENYKLRLLAERRELQFKIATYQSKLNIRVAKPVDPNEKGD